MSVEQVYGTPVLNEKKGPLGGPRWDREPLVLNGRTFHEITEDICAPLSACPHSHGSSGLALPLGTALPQRDRLRDHLTGMGMR